MAKAKRKNREKDVYDYLYNERKEEENIHTKPNIQHTDSSRQTRLEIRRSHNKL